MNSYLSIRGSSLTLSAEDEMLVGEHWYRYRDKDSAEKLFMTSLPYIIGISGKLSGYGLSRDDLIQEGSVGVMRALNNYNPSFGVRFSIYAISYIRGEMYDFVVNNWSIVKISTTRAQRKLFFNLRRSRDEGMSDEDISDMLDVDAEDVRDMGVRMLGYSSLDEESDSFHSVPSMISPDFVDSIEADDYESSRAMGLRSAIMRLDERDRYIIESRRLRDDPKTLTEIGSELGVSAERIRILEGRAMKKISAHLEDTISAA